MECKAAAGSKAISAVSPLAVNSSGQFGSIYQASFKHPEMLLTIGGSIEVVVLKPEHLKTEVPLVLVPGWAATAEVHKRNSILFAEAGRRTIVISAPHGIPVVPGEYKNIPVAEARKAAAIEYALQTKLVNRTDVVTHSEAAIFVTVAALKQPERYRSITYVAPAGLIGADGFWQLARRFNADRIRQISELGKEKGRWSQTLIALREAGKSIASAPLKSIEEVMAIAHAQIQVDIRALHDKGVKIFVVHPAGDEVFPMARMTSDTWERDINGKPIKEKRECSNSDQ